MPAKWKYGFICDGAMQVYGKWTYQGIFDRIQSPGYPTSLPQAFLAFHFNGPVGAHALKIKLVDSKDKLILQEVRMTVECREFLDNDVVAQIGPLPIPGEGFYSFKIFMDEEMEPIGTIDFQAIKIKLGPPGKEAAHADE